MSHFTLLFKHKFDFQNLKSDDQMEPVGNRKELIKVLETILPEIDFSDPLWGFYSGQYGDFEIVLGEDEVVNNIGIRNAPSEELISMLCAAMNLFAFDTAYGQFID